MAKKKSIKQAEGEAHREDTEKLEEKPKEKKTRKPKPTKFPVDGRINNYGFLHFRVGWLTALDWKKGMSLKISKNPDGSITVHKA